MKATSAAILGLLSGVLLIQICAAHVIGDELALNGSTVSRSPRLRLIKSKLASKDDDLDRYKVFDLDQNHLDRNDVDDNADSTEEETSINYTSKVSKDQLLPIVLIPGLEGSRLTATLDKPTSSHYYCKKKAKTPFTIWVNHQFLVRLNSVANARQLIKTITLKSDFPQFRSTSRSSSYRR